MIEYQNINKLSQGEKNPKIPESFKKDKKQVIEEYNFKEKEGFHARLQRLCKENVKDRFTLNKNENGEFQLDFENTQGDHTTVLHPVFEPEYIIEQLETPDDIQIAFRYGLEVTRPYKIKEILKNNILEYMFTEVTTDVGDKKRIGKLLQYYVKIAIEMGRVKKRLNFLGYQNNKLLLDSKEIIISKNKVIEKETNFIWDKINDFKPDNLDTRLNNDKLTAKELTTLKRVINDTRGLQSWGIVANIHNVIDKTPKGIEAITKPILGAFGTTGLGKTSNSKLLTKIGFGTTLVQQYAKSSDVAIRNISDSTNIGYIIIDDYKLGAKSEIDIDMTTRGSYEQQQKNTGVAGGGKRIEQFTYRSPLMITGESDLKEEATLNRTILMEVEKRTARADWDSLRKDDTILIKLKTLLIKRRLKLKDIDIINEYNEVREYVETVTDRIKQINKINIPDRYIENYTAVLQGLKSIDQVIGTKFVEEFELEKHLVECTRTFEDTIINIIAVAIATDEMEQTNKKDEYKQYQILDKKLDIGSEIKISMAWFKNVLIPNLKKNNNIGLEEMDMKMLIGKLKDSQSNDILYKSSMRIGATTKTSGLEIKVNEKMMKKLRELMPEISDEK